MSSWTPTPLSKYFHDYPHLDGGMRQANDSFDPNSNVYMKSIGMIIMLHFVMSLIVLLAVLGIFLLIQLAFPKKTYDKEFKNCLWWTIVVCAFLMFLGLIFEIVFHIMALKLIEHSGNSEERSTMPSDTSYDTNYKDTVENIVFNLMLNTLPNQSEAVSEMTNIKDGIVNLMRNYHGIKDEGSSEYDLYPKMNPFKIESLGTKKWSQFAVMIIIWCIVFAIIVCLLLLLSSSILWLCVLGTLVLVLLLAATLTSEAMFVADACQNIKSSSSRLAKRTAPTDSALDPECEQYVNQMDRYYKHYFNKYEKLYNKQNGKHRALHGDSRQELEGYRTWGESQMKQCASMEERRADSASAHREACEGDTLLMWVTAQLVAVLLAAVLLVGILLFAIYARSCAFTDKDGKKCHCGVPDCGINDACNKYFEGSKISSMNEGKMNPQKTVHGADNNYKNSRKQRTTYIATPPQMKTSSDSSEQYYSSRSSSQYPVPVSKQNTQSAPQSYGSTPKSRSRRRFCSKKKRNKCPQKCFSSGCILKARDASSTNFMTNRGSQTDVASQEVRQKSTSSRKQKGPPKESSKYSSRVDQPPSSQHRTVVKTSHTQHDTSKNSSRKKFPCTFKRKQKVKEAVYDTNQKPSKVRNTRQSPPPVDRPPSPPYSKNYETSMSTKSSKTITSPEQTARKPGRCSRIFRCKRKQKSSMDATPSASTTRSRQSTVRFDEQQYPGRIPGVPCGALKCSDFEKCSCCITLSRQAKSHSRHKPRRESEAYTAPAPVSSGRRRSNRSATSAYTPAYSASTVYVASPFTASPGMTPSSAFMLSSKNLTSPINRHSLKLTPSTQLSNSLGRNPWSPRSRREDNTSRNRSSEYVTSSRSHNKFKRSQFRLKRPITPKFRRKSSATQRFLKHAQDDAIHLSMKSITPESLTPEVITPKSPPLSREKIIGVTVKKRIRTIYLKLTPSMISKRLNVGNKLAPDHYIEASRALDGEDSDESELIAFPVLNISALRALRLSRHRQCDR